MIKRILGLALCLLLTASLAVAQTLPSVSCFSPGLVRVSGAIADGGTVSADMTAEVGALFLARDLSVLGEMMRGLTMRYQGSGGLADGQDSLTLSRDGAQLLSLSSLRNGENDVLIINNNAYRMPDRQKMAQFAGLDALVGAPILERVPLVSIEALLVGLIPGDNLMGFVIAQPFTIEETHSDDGERLTKLDISGAVAVDGNVWKISGFLRQPGGNAPKDTFELTAALDENNTLSFSYASTRKSEITSKNRSGTNSVDTALTMGGRLDGCSISTRLSVTMRNRWTADGENLTEKITSTATFGLTDKRPGREMLRLNDMAVKLKQNISLTTAENQLNDFGAQDALTLTVTMDSFDVADIAANVSWRIGRERAEKPALPEQIKGTDVDSIAQAMKEAVAHAASVIYKQLGEGSVKRITQGL